MADEVGAFDREAVRLAVYRHFASTGRPPSIPLLASHTGLGDPSVRAALRQLHAHRDVVLDGAGTSIVMAHPFTAVPLGFSVYGARTLWWGGCAWDSFAFPHLLADEPVVLVATRCPACDRPHAWNVGRVGAPEGDQLAHFLTPTARIWDDVVHSCANQRIFCGEECIEAWLAAHHLEPGYTLDLGTLWRLAQHWYDGRLDAGYVRREPAQATSYFASVGLTGPFWGL